MMERKVRIGWLVFVIVIFGSLGAAAGPQRLLSSRVWGPCAPNVVFPGKSNAPYSIWTVRWNGDALLTRSGPPDEIDFYDRCFESALRCIGFLWGALTGVILWLLAGRIGLGTKVGRITGRVNHWLRTGE